ncbi:hypothetical protein KAJ61_04660 [Candidatus Parcubacteria bacterium]|nr:hypothetical protein [Candidatus Parcubacteria bacterium]
MKNQIQDSNQNLDSEQHQNKNQLSKKEPFSFISVKTLLAVLVFTALAAVIVGGWVYVIGNYGKNETNNKIIPIVRETQCKIDSDCKLAYAGSNVCLPCNTSIKEYECLSSEEAEKIEEERFKRMVDDKIFCERCLEKPQHICECENGKCGKVKEEVTCAQNAALDFFDDKQGDDPCDRSCEFDSDCKLECGCECISKNEECIYTGLDCEAPNSDYGCQCVNQNCEYSYIGIDADISDWQTYRNEEFGYEVKYSKNMVEIFPDSVFERGSKGNPSFRIKSGGHFAFGVWENPERLLFKEWLEKRDAMGTTYGVHEIIIGNYKGYSALNLIYSCHIEWRGIEKENKFYTFGVEICEDDREISLEIFNQILSTFKFID